MTRRRFQKIGAALPVALLNPLRRTKLVGTRWAKTGGTLGRKQGNRDKEPSSHEYEANRLMPHGDPTSLKLYLARDLAGLFM